MQIENDYDKDVYNGDIGFVVAIDEDLGDVTIDFDGRPVLYGAHELDQVVLAYATTVHKAQGCEYPAVVIPVTTQHYPMLQRNLIYTGITRGRKLVVLVGQKKALAMAVRGSRDRAPLVEARGVAPFGDDRNHPGVPARRRTCVRESEPGRDSIRRTLAEAVWQDTRPGGRA